MNELETLFASARTGDREAFGDWATRVERIVRASVRSFARYVDLEVVVQETLLRMWVLATGPHPVLEGENASLRLALRVARNVAHEELRRARRGIPVALEDCEDAPELKAEPPPGPDPALRRAIEECFESLPPRYGEALQHRVLLGYALPDRRLAAGLGLKLNTFLQHIVRARKAMADCLEGKGVDLTEVSS